MSKLIVYFIACFLLLGCSMLKKKEDEKPFPIPQEKINEQNAGEIVKEAGGNWLYGQGVGETVANAGGIILFPPYAIYLLGNAALSYNGYEPLEVTDALPENAKATWNAAYDSVTSSPGKLSAAVAGEEFRTQDVIKERYQNLADQLEAEPKGPTQ